MSKSAYIALAIATVLVIASQFGAAYWLSTQPMRLTIDEAAKLEFIHSAIGRTERHVIWTKWEVFGLAHQNASMEQTNRDYSKALQDAR